MPNIRFIYLYPSRYEKFGLLLIPPVWIYCSTSTFIKQQSKILHLPQPDLVTKVGVGLRSVRELENGKPTLKLDRVNEVLCLFGHKLAPAPIGRSLLLA